MNARTSGSSVVVVIALVATSALGGSGGGSGNPRTPYRGAPTLEQVKAQRDETKTYWGDAFPLPGQENRQKRGRRLYTACQGYLVR